MSNSDPLDVSLHDQDLREEVELVGHLLVAVNEWDRPLSMDEVDELLGVPRQRQSGSSESQP